MRFGDCGAAVRGVNGRVSISSDEMINPALHHRVAQESHCEWRPSGAGGGRLGVVIPELQSEYGTKRTGQLWRTGGHRVAFTNADMVDFKTEAQCER